MAISTHALDRARERLVEAGIDPADVAAKAERIATAYCTMSLAVRIVRLDRAYGDQSATLDRASNGDEVWAICREGLVKTVMLRRSTQPRTPAAFGVQRVAKVVEK